MTVNEVTVDKKYKKISVNKIRIDGDCIDGIEVGDVWDFGDDLNEEVINEEVIVEDIIIHFDIINDVSVIEIEFRNNTGEIHSILYKGEYTFE